MKYDIIGDIHGHADALVSLLNRLGYTETGGIYSRPDYRAVFVGDFVDRGPAIRETLGLVRRMVDAGSALSVMGNHEYNAICFNRERHDEPHRWLRSRTDRHLYQHIETIYQFRNHRSQWADYLAWFYRLPLYLDLGSVRIVHASWHAPSISLLNSLSSEGNRLSEELLVRATRRGNEEFDAIQNVLKGVEVELPSSTTFIDKDGNTRTEMRIRWWLDAAGRTYREIAMSSQSNIFGTPVSDSDASRVGGYSDTIPVFFGHYWLDGSVPSILTDYVACLDFSMARGGYLAAYRWQGEKTLCDDHFVTHQ
jgi:hypothetical protein